MDTDIVAACAGQTEEPTTTTTKEPEELTTASGQTDPKETESDSGNQFLINIT